MRAFARLCAMFLNLLLTSPLWWAMVAVAMVGWWRYPVAGWLVFLWLILAGVTVLGFTVFLEAGGGLYERIRLAGAGHACLAAATITLVMVSLVLFAVGTVLR